MVVITGTFKLNLVVNEAIIWERSKVSNNYQYPDPYNTEI